MMRKPAFWILSTLLSIGCISFALKYFPDAFPLVSLDLRIDRGQALSRTAELVDSHGWSSETYDQAASFHLDGKCRKFKAHLPDFSGNQASTPGRVQVGIRA